MARFDRGDRDQGQAQVAHFLEQAVQRGLVRYLAMDGGGAVAAVRDAQPVEPGRPPAAEATLQADLVLSGAGVAAAGLSLIALLPILV